MLMETERSFLLSVLLLQWADGLPAGTTDAEEACQAALELSACIPTNVLDL
jgi:hypothetical protein